jgi:hypothetical protein
VTFEITRGTAFLVPSGPRDELHLHVVLTDESDQGDHLVASVSSIKKAGWHDPTCCFDGGEHDSITKPSFVFYRLTTRMTARHIKNMLAKKLFKEKPPVSDDVCDSICDGITKSEHTPRGVKKYFEKYGD